MNINLKIAALGLAGTLALTGCTAVSAATTEPTSTTTSESTPTSDSTPTSEPSPTTTESTTPTDDRRAAGPGGGGPGGGVDASSVTTEDELIALIQDAYGDPGLDLHRGHQPVQDVLDEVLTISHDELHVRMDAGQNLSDVAEELGVGTETLVDALVASRSAAVDNLLAAGTITQDEADAYLTALEEAFTFRVTWDGAEETPTFSGLNA